MAMITLQVKLSEETIQQIDALRGPEMGWAQSAIARQLIEDALARLFFTPGCSEIRTNEALASRIETADIAA